MKMKTKIIGLDGSSKGTAELPAVFSTAYKPKLIRRAVLAIQTAMKQPKGADARAGKKTPQLILVREERQLQEEQ